MYQVGLSRKNGILSRVMSLPGRSGIGEAAMRFVNFVHASSQGIWQVPENDA